MKIEIELEQSDMFPRGIILKYRVEQFGKIACFNEIMENDWMQDKSIFRRVVEGASYKLQKLYNDSIKGVI
jgi:hypothetical protein